MKTLIAALIVLMATGEVMAKKKNKLVEEAYTKTPASGSIIDIPEDEKPLSEEIKRLLEAYGWYEGYTEPPAPIPRRRPFRGM